MFTSTLVAILNTLVGFLLEPVIACLLAVTALAVFDAGLSVGERFGGLRRLAAIGDLMQAERLGRRRVERADLIARVGPMLGLMGTLIPLGPGLAALGDGDLTTLGQAVMVAFDTTVLGLLVGIVGFVVGRLRRRWYDGLLDAMDAQAPGTVA